MMEGQGDVDDLGDAESDTQSLTNPYIEPSLNDAMPWEEKLESSSRQTLTLQTSSFHQFQKLPPELRRRVWELFCPDLVRKSRMLKFEAILVTKPDQSTHWTFEDSMEMSRMTEDLRSVAKVCMESRTIVKGLFPDTLKFRATYGDLLQGEICYSKERDVVLLSGVSDSASVVPRQDGFCEQLHSVAFFASEPEEFLTTVPPFLDALPNLKNVYMCQTPSEYSRVYGKRSWKWGISRLARCARITTYQISDGIGEDTDTAYSWPNWSTVSMEPAISGAVAQFTKQMSSEFRTAMDNRDVRMGPMISFDQEDGRYDLTQLVKLHDAGSLNLETGEYSDSEDSENSAEGSEDEYDSEGIDDTEQPELEESSEDELVPRRVFDEEDSEEDSEEESDADQDEIAADQTIARFSSPESESDQDEGTHSGVVRRPKRRIVEDSDDDDGSVEAVGPSRKKARRSAIVISSDAEDGDGGPVNDGPGDEDSVHERIDISITTSEDESADGSEPIPVAGPVIDVTLRGAPEWRNTARSAPEWPKNKFVVEEDEESSETGTMSEMDGNDATDDNDDDNENEGEERNGYSGHDFIDDMASESGDGGEEEFDDSEDNY